MAIIRAMRFRLTPRSMNLKSLDDLDLL